VIADAPHGVAGAFAGDDVHGEADSPTALSRRSVASSEGPLRLLIIEDSPSYAALVEQTLRRVLGGEVEVLHRDAVSGARQALVEESIDCVLLDLSLPDAGGLEALEAVQSTAAEVPVVVLTGTEDRGLAVRAVHDGAQDFLVKRSANAELLARAVRYAIERKDSEVRLTHHALHDPLTTLPNRVLLLDHLNGALARTRRHPTSLAVMFIDLDGFKAVNDSLGHDAGDELLIELSRRLHTMLRPSDTVARFGGDEFLILCEDLRSHREAIQVAERVRAVIAEPVALQGREISLRASVGIAFARANGTTAEGLITEADLAMYRAKRCGSGIESFKKAMHAGAVAELETEHELRGALERDELRVYYQPEIALEDGGRAFGVEALLRWEHPRRGLLSPADFMALAEETGLMVPIGEWMLSRSCRQLAAWRRDWPSLDDLILSANMSLRQLGSPRLLEGVELALADSGLPPRCLCIEVTESYVAEDPASLVTVLDGLKGLGVTLALDDFGTGYSSLSALSSYPVDMIKVDRSFIDGVSVDPAAARMYEAVLGVVRAAQLRAVAEGVETQPQLEFLKRLGCEAAQGFVFARPATGREILPGLVRAAYTVGAP
jgi:diguanylate cyclase (GGDEF)-like protein